MRKLHSPRVRLALTGKILWSVHAASFLQILVVIRKPTYGLQYGDGHHAPTQQTRMTMDASHVRWRLGNPPNDFAELLVLYVAGRSSINFTLDQIQTLMPAHEHFACCPRQGVWLQLSQSVDVCLAYARATKLPLHTCKRHPVQSDVYFRPHQRSNHNDVFTVLYIKQ